LDNALAFHLKRATKSVLPSPAPMKPQRQLAETTTPDGGSLALYEHDGNYCVRLNGQALMDSSVTASELLLGELAAGQLAAKTEASILIGGLGLGFTLKSLLQRVGTRTRVQVAELLPAVVDWNRTFLAGVNGALLNDPRVKVVIADVWDIIARAGPNRYDAILLDIDNGPVAMVQKRNARLYADEGIERLLAVLKPGGRAAIWSAGQDRAFAARLTKAGLKVEMVPAKLHATAKRCAYTIYVADKLVTLPDDFAHRRKGAERA
jgi:spermidine synthase